MRTCGVYCRCSSWLQLVYYGSSHWQRNTVGDSINKGVDQQLCRALHGVHAHYIEFHTLRSSDLSYTIKCRQSLDSPKFFTKDFLPMFQNAAFLTAKIFLLCIR